MAISPMSFAQGQTLIQQNKQIIALLTEIRDQSQPEEPTAEEPATDDVGAETEVEIVPILSVNEEALAQHIKKLRESGWNPMTFL